MAVASVSYTHPGLKPFDGSGFENWLYRLERLLKRNAVLEMLTVDPPDVLADSKEISSRISVAKVGEIVNSDRCGNLRLLTSNGIGVTMHKVLACDSLSHNLLSVKRLEENNLKAANIDLLQAQKKLKTLMQETKEKYDEVVTDANFLGEYSNIELEQLLTWVNTMTTPKAVFAGPMPVMANLMLSTRRPIVNHPHYENAALRERTKKVYSAFSRKTPQEVFNILTELQVEYLVLEEAWCFRGTRGGCSLLEIWDVEDPKNVHNQPVCPILFLKNSPLFQRVFANDIYVVLRLHTQYVEIRALVDQQNRSHFLAFPLSCLNAYGNSGGKQSPACLRLELLQPSTTSITRQPSSMTTLLPLAYGYMTSAFVVYVKQTCCVGTEA
uniref:Uncharacterized protein n=1 Tax=Timema monikensis TaxID=170555 RepID=A0A7R9EH39_9NEOP|nr:unnamed protein product [Timema monikensis]